MDPLLSNAFQWLESIFQSLSLGPDRITSVSSVLTVRQGLGRVQSMLIVDFFEEMDRLRYGSCRTAMSRMLLERLSMRSRTCSFIICPARYATEHRRNTCVVTCFPVIATVLSSVKNVSASYMNQYCAGTAHVSFQFHSGVLLS